MFLINRRGSENVLCENNNGFYFVYPYEDKQYLRNEKYRDIVDIIIFEDEEEAKIFFIKRLEDLCDYADLNDENKEAVLDDPDLFYYDDLGLEISQIHIDKEI